MNEIMLSNEYPLSLKQPNCASILLGEKDVVPADIMRLSLDV